MFQSNMAFPLFLEIHATVSKKERERKEYMQQRYSWIHIFYLAELNPIKCLCTSPLSLLPKCLFIWLPFLHINGTCPLQMSFPKFCSCHLTSRVYGNNYHVNANDSRHICWQKSLHVDITIYSIQDLKFQMVWVIEMGEYEKHMISFRLIIIHSLADTNIPNLDKTLFWWNQTSWNAGIALAQNVALMFVWDSSLSCFWKTA